MDISITMTEHEWQAMYAVPLEDQGELPATTRLPVEIEGNVVKALCPTSFQPVEIWPLGAPEAVGNPA